MPPSLMLIASVALCCIGVYAIWRHSRNDGTRPHPGGGQVALPASQENRIRVTQGDALITMLQADHFIDGIRDRMGFDSALFKQDCLPVIQKAAEWVQMLPASESHHHAHPGGLLIHMLESATHALRFRQGFLLPVGAQPEEIPARKHRWTFAVFLAALLHDIGRPVSDINVLVFRAGKSCGKWHPLAGSMLDQGITEYALDFELARNYDLHQKLPIVLFQRLVPPHVLAWLAGDVELMAELSAYLSGSDQGAGALKQIVTRADSESVKNNLMHGPRTRFASAKTVPLIERLMQALRLMLEEGRLSLNRAGSHGWVYDGKLWFVSKRLADEVRAFLVERESGEGIPGKDKNDRLFDTWQEYGALITTADNRAVWQVMVKLDEGWEQKLTVLCFPLDKLFKQPEQYPEPVKGSVVATQVQGHPAAQDANDGGSSEPVNITASDSGLLDSETSRTEINGELALPFKDDAVHDSTSKGPMSSDSAAPIKRSSTALPPIRPPNVQNKATSESTNAGAPRGKPDQSEYLNADDSAAEPRPKPPQSAALKPIAPAGQNMAPFKPGAKRKEPTAAAMRFMRWIQEGLSEGTLSYNRADAMIHFVDEGMMLVSPVAFRKFAELFGEEGDGTPSDRAGSKLGTGIQRQVTNAGWHLVTGDKKNNIQRYVVIGADGQGKKLISGVIVLDPVQFVNPLPPNNPCIVRFDKPLEHA